MLESAPNALGDYLQKLRKDKGMSLRDLEKETGVSNCHLSQVERGRRTPSIVIAYQLSVVLGCPLETIAQIAFLNDMNKKKRRYARKGQAHP